MYIKNNRGFSLIEVLVTVGLIGILVSIAIPSYNKYKKNTLTMAIKSDVGNGHKAYSAYDAVQGTYCATLNDVGMQVLMTSQTYRKQGAYGFGEINTDCAGQPSDVNQMSYKNKGFCLDSSGAPTTGADQTACVGVSGNKWITDNKFGGDLSACTLGSDEFDLGAYTNTSALDTFIVVNEAGKIATITGDICTVVP